MAPAQQPESDGPSWCDEMVGTVLDGRYELVEVVGQGGMGAVFRAQDQRLKRVVAVKVMNPGLDPQVAARFLAEAVRVAGLGEHPCLVTVHDSVQDRSGKRYITMQYVEGRTLADVLADGPLPVAEAVRVVGDVLSALAYAHAGGVVHRDIKPANVMVAADGQVKVVDFGIARHVDDTVMTPTGSWVGTPHYVAPEQVLNKPVDARADLYSTGCLLFRVLTGRPPFVGDNGLALAHAHVYDTPPRPTALRPDLPAAVDDIIAKALAKEPCDRYETAGGFRAALVGLMVGPDREQKPDGLSTVTENVDDARDASQDELHAGPSQPGRRTVLVGLGAVLTATAVGVGWARLSDQPPAGELTGSSAGSSGSTGPKASESADRTVGSESANIEHGEAWWSERESELWGPSRGMYTMSSPSPIPLFNSIKDNPVVGDERDFVRIRHAGSSNEMWDNWYNAVRVKPGDVLSVQIYFENSCADNLEDCKILGARMGVTIWKTEIESEGRVYEVLGRLWGSNVPKVQDAAWIYSSIDVTLEIDFQRSRFHSNYVGREGAPIGVAIIGGQGLKIGGEEADGVVAPGYVYMGYALLQIKVIEAR